ncbi:hypothetical protein [Knoellia koreensis]|uniref:Uncharacterized protein n=1 Tax=Knoellia koreensis TaxID=2730921 RepID=A0A849HGI3_9MICO|nr:hypothetical protein [Knoellia sp. DB2414S]NNM46299.1 hypothetical protein [Knoellia sp. DB2414S]
MSREPMLISSEGAWQFDLTRVGSAVDGVFGSHETRRTSSNDESGEVVIVARTEVGELQLVVDEERLVVTIEIVTTSELAAELLAAISRTNPVSDQDTLLAEWAEDIVPVTPQTTARDLMGLLGPPPPRDHP